MSTEELLVVSHLAKAYRAGNSARRTNIRVLRDVSLAVRRGELVTVHGASGSGKTTLLLCASGMLRPDLGGVRWPALAPRAGCAPPGVAYVGPRAPMYAFLTVRESLAYAATVRELHAPGTASTDDNALERAGLTSQSATRVGLLQKEEQARFLLALALIGTPQLLLVDDLVDGLSTSQHASFGACLLRLASEGAAVVWATRALAPVDGASASFLLGDGWLRGGTSAMTPAPAPVPWIPGYREAPRAISVAERPPVSPSMHFTTHDGVTGDP